MSMPEHKYDSMQALEILGAYAEEKNPTRGMDAREAAAVALLEELRSLDKRVVDLAAVRQHDGSVAIGFSFGGATVTYMSGRFHCAADEHSKPVPIPLVFNRARNVFEGTTVDATRVPVPGEPVQKKRDALAVIADALVATIRAG
jgi:hypothetical protein